MQKGKRKVKPKTSTQWILLIALLLLNGSVLGYSVWWLMPSRQCEAIQHDIAAATDADNVLVRQSPSERYVFAAHILQGDSRFADSFDFFIVYDLDDCTAHQHRQHWHVAEFEGWSDDETTLSIHWQHDSDIPHWGMAHYSADGEQRLRCVWRFGNCEAFIGLPSQ